MVTIQKFSLSAVMAAVLTAVALPARAAFIVTIQQVGSDVVATGSGTINTTALAQGSNVGGGAAFRASSAYVALGPSAPENTYSGGVTGPSSYGSSSSYLSGSGTGDAVGINAGTDVLDVPVGYISGASLSDTATFTGQTFSSLDLTPGTYTYNWGTGPTADSFIVTTSVPEPASLSIVGIGAMALLGRRRRSAI